MDIHKNVAFLVLEEDDCYGKVHPRDAMLPEIVLLVCAHIRQMLQSEEMVRQENETITITRQELSELILACRKKWNAGWSKEYREMDAGKLVDSVRAYMKDWMFIRENEDKVIILPATGKMVGFYPEDFREEE